jgi:MscS family membrane protein
MLTLLAQTTQTVETLPTDGATGPAGPWWDVFVSFEFLNNELWRWVALFGVLLIALVAGKFTSLILLREGEKYRDRAGRAWVFGAMLRSAGRPLPLLLLGVGLWITKQFMDLKFEITNDQGITEIKDLTETWSRLTGTLVAIAITWFVYLLVDILEHWLTHLTSRSRSALDDQLVPMLRKTLRIVIVIMAALFIAQNIYKWDIGALIAGLGLGGLAFALAAKDMLANFFGSITIFADRPFTLGDRVVIDGQDGMVEEVGFRSTRIRTLQGHLVTVPNGTVANTTVENIGRRPSIKRVLNVTVTYDTSLEKMEEGVAILRDMLDKRMEHFPVDSPPRVYFSDFNAASLNIVVYYWFAPPDWWEYLQFTHEFNMELLRRFNEAGIEFAFPTQTLYVKQDSPLQADIRSLPPEQTG